MKSKKCVESQSLEEFYKNLRRELGGRLGDGLTFDIPREEFVFADTIRTEWGRKVVAEAEGLLNLELTLVSAYVARDGMILR